MTALNKHTQSGFTLLEILAAIVLLSIGSALFLNTLSNSTRALDKDRQITYLALFAKSILERQITEPLRTGQWHGKNQDIQWQLTSTLIPGTPPTDIYRLELIVERDTHKQKLVTLRAQSSSAVQR
ncbi:MULTISPECIES: type II secretion system protein [unclassified Pseudomonas]|uniref:type IV pilus modification PilV family protein n=1 Tax=unclassified Pseudomonas TaxID=196821 RepID=UPI002A363385|nr:MULTISPECIES: type II secretion system protein [unclassified Pseudomonas]MDX9669575.1 type II secretion system protein [Pseudomonas sp. P8_250]WPN36389.1 type II secretion system protein [Pseudomonas sp. P8_139]WPN41810.1 type II secretion system protein [Pseudomonas sp. P8_229]